MIKISMIKNIKSKALERGFTQATFAARLGLPEERANKIMSGKIPGGLTLKTVARFCDALDCPPGEILVVDYG